MNLWEMSLTGGILIAAILLLRRCALFRLPKWTFLLLWGAALCRLLIPFSLPSPFSVYTGAERLAQAVSSVQEEHLTGPVPQPESHYDELPVILLPLVPQEGEAAPARPADPEQAAFPPLTALYLTGVGMCVLWFAAAYLRCLLAFRNAEPASCPQLDRWQSTHPRPQVRLLCSGAVAAPLTYGLFRPTILFPLHMDWSDGDTLSYILAHEYVHIRRKDVFWKLLLAAALCVHWFNPAVWAMYLFANRDLELACDEAVVHSFGLSARPAYALSLIQAAESRPGFLPLCSGYKKSAAEERIRAIMKTKKRSLAVALVGLAAALGIAVLFVSSPAPAERTPDPDTSQTSPAQSHNPARPVQPPDSKPTAEPEPVTQPTPDLSEPTQPEPEPVKRSEPAPAPPHTTSKPASAYPVNRLGHTYGVWSPEDGYDDVPDLIYVHWDSEHEGYMKREEVYPYGWYLGPESSQEERQRYLNWYHELTSIYDDTTKIGGMQKNFYLYTLEESAAGCECSGLALSAPSDLKLSDEALLALLDQGTPVTWTFFSGTAPAENIPVRLHQPARIPPKTEKEWAYLREWTDENGDWRRNSKGQTYGPESLAYAVGYYPDLLYVESDDCSGYITWHTRMYGNYPDPVNTSEEWDAFKKWQKTRNMVELVDLYDVEMNECSGYMRYWNYT